MICICRVSYGARHNDAGKWLILVLAFFVPPPKGPDDFAPQAKACWCKTDGYVKYRYEGRGRAKDHDPSF